MIKMIGTNVLVTEVEKEETSTGGIILSGDVTKGSKQALILAVGPEATHLNKGDRVFLNWDKAMPVDVKGNPGAIIEMEYIRAVME
tara:strand:- start:399 stop:656 length:258 start_codon:yes stop_codon:yes gene_type:complete